MMMYIVALPGFILVGLALKRLLQGHSQIAPAVRAETIALTRLAKRLRMTWVAPGVIRGSRDGFRITVKESLGVGASTYRVTVELKSLLFNRLSFSREATGFDATSDLDTGDEDFDRTVHWQGEGARSWASFIDKHTRKSVVEFLKVSPDAALVDGCLTFSVSVPGIPLNALTRGVTVTVATAKALRRALNTSSPILLNTVAGDSVALVRERALRHLLTQFPVQRKHVIKALQKALIDVAPNVRRGAAIAVLESGLPQLRQQGEITLREVSDGSVLEALHTLLSTSESLLVLEQACLALKRLGDRTSVLPLREFSKATDDSMLRELARSSLSAIQGRLGAGNAGGIALVEEAHHEGALSVGDFGAVSEAPEELAPVNDDATRTR